MSELMFSILLLAGVVAVFATVFGVATGTHILWTMFKMVCKNRWLWMVDLWLAYRSWSQKRAVYRKTRRDQRKRDREAYKVDLARRKEMEKMFWAQEMARAEQERQRKRQRKAEAIAQRKSLKADQKKRAAEAKQAAKEAKIAAKEAKIADILAQREIKRMKREVAVQKRLVELQKQESDAPRKRPGAPPRPRPKPRARTEKVAETLGGVITTDKDGVSEVRFPSGFGGFVTIKTIKEAQGDKKKT